MLFLGETKMPDGVLPGPDKREWWQRGRDYRSQFAELTAASHREQMLLDNSEGELNSAMEAYDNRISEIAKATGVELQNPIRQPGYVRPDIRMRLLGVERGKIAYNRELEDSFSASLKKLATERPELAGVIRPDIPISADAAQIAREARQRADRARAGAKDLKADGGFLAQALGAGSAMLRDPLGATTAFIGGGSSSVAKGIAGRVLTRVGTEAVANGGSEAVMQLMAQEWRQKAGVEDPGFWQNVGLAAAFGGGVGGAIEGGAAAFRAIGKDTPAVKDALARIANDGGTPADMQILADAAGVKLAESDLADLARAAEVDGDAAAVHAASDTAGTEVKAIDDAVSAIERDLPISEPAIDVPAPVRPGINSGINPAPKPEAPSISKPLTEDEDFLDFVRNLQEEKELALEAFIRENDIDLAHLKAGGSARELPSGRTFDNIRAAGDNDFAKKVEAEINRKIERDVKAIKARGNVRADDPAVQLRYTELMRPREVVAPEIRAGNVEPRTQQALDAAKAATAREAAPAGSPEAVAAAGEKVAPAAPSPKTGTSLDAIDGVPTGIDAAGNPVVVKFSDLMASAEKTKSMADLVAACKVA